MINIYVGNLPYKTSEADLAELFGQFGKVERASIVMDRETGRSRGFGFVEMTDHALGTQAIETLSGQDYHGRSLTINEARPRDENNSSGGGGGGGYTPRYQPAPTSFGESSGYRNNVANRKPTRNNEDSLDGAEPSQGYSNPGR
jgi:RNA recognition motif-containing protein